MKIKLQLNYCESFFNKNASKCIIYLKWTSESFIALCMCVCIFILNLDLIFYDFMSSS